MRSARKFWRPRAVEKIGAPGDEASNGIEPSTTADSCGLR